MPVIPMPSFSIILTTYNSGKHVLKTIDSILEQDGKGNLFTMELIIVDDCSTDGTRELFMQMNIDFESTDINSGGANKGRNIGMKKAKNDWIIIADHDDIWYPYRLKTLTEDLFKADIITSAYDIQDTMRDTTHSLASSHGAIKEMYEKNKTFIKLITKDNRGKQITYLGCLCFRNTSTLPTFEEEVGQVDFDWICKLFRAKKSFHINKTLYLRIQDGKNLSRNENYRLEDYRISKSYLESIQSDFPNLVKLGLQGVDSTMARYYYAENKMKLARKYLRKSRLTLKNVLYYLTSYVGHRYVNQYFRVFD